MISKKVYKGELKMLLKKTEKKIIYYQFNQVKYYSEHLKKGYFDCERDGFGPIINEEEKLVEKIIKSIGNENIDEKYYERAKAFFPLYDDKNCKRNYKEIKKI